MENSQPTQDTRENIEVDANEKEHLSEKLESQHIVTEENLEKSQNFIENSQNWVNPHSNFQENRPFEDNLSSQDLLIRVSDPIKKDGIKSYVTYTIKIANVNELFHRRYSDFFFLREKLVGRWPGVYIPNIPPKKTMGNLETKIVEMRMKLLDKFCLKLSKFQIIFHSEEMKIFFANGTGNSVMFDIKKALSVLPQQSCEDLLLKYKRAFPDFYETFEMQPAKIKINDFQAFLKKSLTNLKLFKDVVQNSMNKKQQEIENYLSLISVFSDYEKYTLLEYSENDDNKLIFFNPKNTDLCMKLLKLVSNFELF